MSRKRRFYLILIIGTCLLLVHALAMCTASMLPDPQSEPTAWATMAQIAGTSRLFTFLAWLTVGSGCTSALLPGVLIIVLLAIIMWRARPGGAQ